MPKCPICDKPTETYRGLGQHVALTNDSKHRSNSEEKSNLSESMKKAQKNSESQENSEDSTSVQVDSTAQEQKQEQEKAEWIDLRDVDPERVEKEYKRDVDGRSLLIRSLQNGNSEISFDFESPKVR